MFFLEPFIIDFTLSEGEKLSILEFGLLHSSGTTGYDSLYPDTPIAANLLSFYREQMGENTSIITFPDGLQQVFRLQSTNPTEQNILLREATFGYRLSAHHAKNLADLILLATKVASDLSNPVLIKIPPKLCHENILALLHEDIASAETSSWHVSSTVAPWTAMCRNKASLAQYLEGNPLIPKTLLGTMGERQEDVTRFLNETMATHYVLKPTNASRGIGVVVLENKNVLSFFQGINEGTCTVAYWRQHPNANYVLQICQPSKIISAANGKMYRPTGRLVLAPYFEGNLLQFKILGSYWKLPEHSVDNVDSDYTTDNLVSRISSRTVDNQPISEPISVDDMQIILQQFQQYISPALGQIIGNFAKNTTPKPEIVTASVDAFIIKLYELIYRAISEYDHLDGERKTRLALVLFGIPYSKTRSKEINSPAELSRLITLWQKKEYTCFDYLLKNRLDDTQAEFLMRHLDLTPMDKVRELNPTSIAGLEAGFTMENVQASWFKAVHVFAVTKYGLTVEEACNKHSLDICKITRLIDEGTPKEQAILQVSKAAVQLHSEKISFLYSFFDERNKLRRPLELAPISRNRKNITYTLHKSSAEEMGPISKIEYP